MEKAVLSRNSGSTANGGRFYVAFPLEIVLAALIVGAIVGLPAFFKWAMANEIVAHAIVTILITIVGAEASHRYAPDLSDAE